MTQPPGKHADVQPSDVTADGTLDGRRARSQRTYARVVAAARELFLEQGYARTSIETIGARAGVTAQTVYNQFGTKCELLAAVLDRAVAGDAAPLEVTEWPGFVVGDAEPVADTLARFAASGTAILARAAPVYDVIRSASALPEVRQLLTDSRRHRRAHQRDLVRTLAAAGQLRPDLNIDHAADVVYGLMNEDLYLLLTGDCGWSRKRFSTWLARTLLQQLLATPDPPEAKRRRSPPRRRAT